MNDSQKRQIDQGSDSFFEAYYFVLRSYSEQEIRKAAFKCCDELSFYPTPKELADRIPHRANDKHTQELIDMWTCQICKQKVSAISDGMCLDCAQINPQFVKKKEKHEPIKQENFRMEGRRMCQKCKTGPTLCIKEPADSGIWLCQLCYSGLTAEERRQRIRDIMKMIKNKHFIPEWAL